jgi:hypothetical protein
MAARAVGGYVSSFLRMGEERAEEEEEEHHHPRRGDPAAETAIPSVLTWPSCLQIAGLAGPGEECIYRP